MAKFVKSKGMTIAKNGSAPQAHRLPNDPGNVALVNWDGKKRSFVAKIVPSAKGLAQASDAHPTKYVPIAGDPAHVLECDWNQADNQYHCIVVPTPN